MIELQSTWKDVSHLVAAGLDELLQALQQKVPETSLQVVYPSNDTFPFRACGTFCRSRGDICIDISIDCIHDKGILRLWADVSRESGFILSEFPEISIELSDPNIRQEVLKVFYQIKSYMINQQQLVLNELTS